jgi:hypothetical protein
MAGVFIVMVILFSLIALLIVSSFRPSRLTVRREIVGRPRRRTGAVLLAIGLLGIVGGQWIALAGAPKSVAADGMDTMVTRPKPGKGGEDQMLFRVFTVSDLVPGKPRLLEHLAFLMKPGVTVERKATGLGGLAGGTFSASYVNTPQGTQVEFTAQFDQTMGTHGIGTGGSFPRGGRMTEGLSITRNRQSSGRFSALFPATTYPASLLTRTVVLVDPVPAGVEEVPFAELWSGDVGERIRAEAVEDPHESSRRATRSTSGIGLVFGALGIYAWLMLVLTGVGTAWMFRRPGLGLALFFLLVPVLLAATDYLSLSHQRSNLAHEDVQVRAAAMAGLRSSMFFGDSGSRALSEVLTGKDGVDREVAGRVQALVKRVRKVK